MLYFTTAFLNSKLVLIGLKINDFYTCILQCFFVFAILSTKLLNPPFSQLLWHSGHGFLDLARDSHSERVKRSQPALLSPNDSIGMPSGLWKEREQ